MQFGGLVQRRQVCNLVHLPPGGFELGRRGAQRVPAGGACRELAGRCAQRHAMVHGRAGERCRHPPGIARIGPRQHRQGHLQVLDGAGERPRHGGELRPDIPLADRPVVGRDPAECGPQPVDAAGVGRIADRASDVGAVRDRADAGGDCGRGAAGRAAWRQLRIMRVQRTTVETVRREPSIRERRGVGAPEDDGAGRPQARHDRAVGRRDAILAQRHAVGCGEPGLIEVDLDGDRNAGERSRVVAAGDRRVDRGGLPKDIVGPAVDHGVQRRVHRLETFDRRAGDVRRRGRPRPCEGGDLAARHLPNLVHIQILSPDPAHVLRGRWLPGRLAMVYQPLEPVLAIFWPASARCRLGLTERRPVLAPASAFRGRSMNKGAKDAVTS